MVSQTNRGQLGKKFLTRHNKRQRNICAHPHAAAILGLGCTVLHRFKNSDINTAIEQKEKAAKPLQARIKHSIDKTSMRTYIVVSLCHSKQCTDTNNTLNHSQIHTWDETDASLTADLTELLGLFCGSIAIAWTLPNKQMACVEIMNKEKMKEYGPYQKNRGSACQATLMY